MAWTRRITVGSVTGLALAPAWLLASWLGHPATASADPTEPGELQNGIAVAEGCATCHAYSNAAPNADRPLHAPIGWQGSLMANSARDPVFWAGLALANQDDPTHTEDCVRCHVPNAFLDDRADVTAIDQLTPPDRQGISCDLCHRMVDDGVTPAGNARYEIDDTAVDGSVPKRGPFDYAVNAPNHNWIVDDTFLPSSRFCGTCHDVTTVRERVDENGVGMGVPFNEQRTYREWQNSDYALPGSDARSCQDCHMPAVEDAGGCASFEANDRHASGVRRHELVGANRFVTGLLKDLYGDAGSGEVDDAFWDYSIERIDEFVTTAATLEVTFPDEVDASAGIDAIDVTVTNETGHKLPSGYSEGRVMWIEVTATYADQVLWSSGAWDQGAGSIEDDPQVRRYEGIAEDADDGTRNHLLRNNRWVSDTRIPPRGLSADPETDPVGDRYALLPDDTWPNYDEASYQFGPSTTPDATPADANDDEVELRVRLLYLINTPEYVAQLDTDNTSNAAGAELRAAFDDRGGAVPVVLAERSTIVPLRGLDGDGGDDGGDDGGTGEGGDTDGGASGRGGSNDGCACATTPSAPGRSGALGLLVLGSLLASRRRRQAALRR